jgi:hypothetical protein
MTKDRTKDHRPPANQHIPAKTESDSSTGPIVTQQSNSASDLHLEIERLQKENQLLIRDWCEDDEHIKTQALRVLPAHKLEGDYPPRMGAIAELLVEEILSLRQQLTVAESFHKVAQAELKLARYLLEQYKTNPPSCPDCDQQ